MADADDQQDEVAEDEINEPEKAANENVEIAQNESDDQLENEFELEEVPIERPRVSLRKRLQFES